MSILLTNIGENRLNQNIIKESFNELKKHRQLKEKLKKKEKEKEGEIREIFYLNEKTLETTWEFKDVKVSKFKIAMEEDMGEVYENINQIIKDVLDKKEFVNVIVDTSFLAYIILEILIKKFDITNVFILEESGLKKAHPCGCGEEYMGY